MVVTTKTVYESSFGQNAQKVQMDSLEIGSKCYAIEG